MCTLVVRFDPAAELPLVIATNRDERLDRPASAPRIWGGPVPFIAPIDEQAHGTWLGLNARGLFVGVTNRFGAERDPARQSRGQLVVDSLAAPDAASLHARLGGLDPAAYNAFHLYYADARGAFVTWSDGTRVRQDVLPPGLHIVTERSLGGDDASRTERVRTFWRERVTEPPPPDALAALMRLHDEDNPLGATCVHVPAFGYGTRSSTLLWRSRELARSRLLWAPAAPCRSEYEDLSPMLVELAGRT
jgi:uncharacterized protein with NRDE domain